MLYGSCVRTSGSYEAKDNGPDVRVAQATRVGDTVWLWCFNPKEQVKRIPIELVNGKIKSAKAFGYVGGKKVTPNSIRELKVETTGDKKLSIHDVPEYSIAVVEIQLEDDGQLLPLQKWKRIKPKRDIFEASLNGVSGKNLVFKTAGNKSIRLPIKSLSPEHHSEIRDAIKAHRIEYTP